METIDVIDIYTIGDKTYVDLNPAEFIELKNHEIADKFFPEPPSNLEVYRTTTYNVAIFLKFDKLESVNFNKKTHKSKVVESGPALTSQLCLVFKNEWSRIQNYLNFYKRVHGINRFLLYDNNSTEEPLTDLIERDDVIYIPWRIPYKYTLKDKANLHEDYTGPDEIIVGQNSAYSHALKRYGDATWTAFLDTDEFVVRRSYGPSINSILEQTNPSTDTLILRGFWAGCNNFNRDEIYKNLRRISRRGVNFCMNKLILRTSQHVFTDCVHRAYPTNGSSVLLAYEKGIYFFHLRMLSEKRRERCKCDLYCGQKDQSFIESWHH
jgi:hypothetical protein